MLVYMLISFLVLTAAEPAPAPAAPPALAELVATERAFASMAAEQGIKEAFLHYIADDGVHFQPGPVNHKESLRAERPLPPGLKMHWEPRYGDIAASGELGYLTGPVTVEVPLADGTLWRGHSAFFSVWRRSEGGEWRNVLDIGARLPAPAEFAPGFTRAPSSGRFAGAATREEAKGSLAAAEAELHRRAREDSLASAFAGVADPAVRLHRHARLVAGRDEALRFLGSTTKLAEAATLFVDAAASGDFGYTYGRYAVSGEGGDTGHYARVWVRQQDGAWRLVADITSSDQRPREWPRPGD